MKDIRITQINRPDKSCVRIKNRLYRVALGNGVTCYFYSMKHSKQFSAETTRFLNSMLQELNYIYIMVFELYRYAWLYLDTKTDNELFSLVADINKNLSSASGRRLAENSNHFAFIQLLKACGDLEQVCDTIYRLHAGKKHYERVRQVEMIRSNLNRHIINELEKYGKECEYAADIEIMK